MVSFLTVFLVVVAAAMFVAGQKLQEKEIELLRAELASARADAAHWKAAADAQKRSAQTQAELAAACVRREFRAREEEAAVAAVMSGAEPRERAPEDVRLGVDDATRRRAADLLNRPW